MRCDYGEISQQTRPKNWHSFFSIASVLSAVASPFSFFSPLGLDTLDNNVRDFRAGSRLPRQDGQIEKVYPSTLSRSLERLAVFLRGFS